MELLLGAIVVVVVYLIWRNYQKTRHGAKTTNAREDAVLSRIERQTLGLIEEFPNLSDDEIAQLLRDDLVNHRVKDPEAFRWALPETVGRVRRNVLREIKAINEGRSLVRRKAREPPEASTADDENGPLRITPRT